MNAIGGDNDIGVDLDAVGERHPGLIIALLELDAFMTTMDHIGGKSGGEEVDEVRPVHAICGIPAGGVRDLYWCDNRAVISQIL